MYITNDTGRRERFFSYLMTFVMFWMTRTWGKDAIFVWYTYHLLMYHQPI